jgi:hypothetical protein
MAMGQILLLIGLLLCFGPLGFLIWLVLMLFCGCGNDRN